MKGVVEEDLVVEEEGFDDSVNRALADRDRELREIRELGSGLLPELRDIALGKKRRFQENLLPFLIIAFMVGFFVGTCSQVIP